MNYKEVNPSFFILKRKSQLITLIITALCCIPLFLQKTFAAADTASLNKEINTLWKNRGLPPDTMVASLARIREKCRQADYRNGVAKTLLYTALTYGQSGNLDQCRRSSIAGIPWCDTSPAGQKLLNFFYNQLANCDNKEGKYALAAAWYYKALLVAAQSRVPSSIVRTNTNIGVLLNDLGKPPSALLYLAEAERICRKEKMELELGMVLVNKGISYDYLRKPDSCRKAYSEAIGIARRQHHNQLLITGLYGMGNALLSQKKAREALSYGNMAVQLTRNNVDVYNSMFPYYVVGNAYYHLHRYDSAVFYLEKFIAIAKNLNLIRYQSEASKSLGRIYYETHQPAKAIPYLVQYIGWQDSLINADMDLQTTEMQLRYLTTEKEKQLIQKELLLARRENDLRKKYFIITIISVLVILVLLAVYIRQRHQRKQRLEKLRQLRQMQQMMQLRAMIDGEEKERRRIARELHDDIGGLLAVTRMQLDVLKQNGNRQDYEEMSQLLEKVSYGVRGTAHKLLPDIILRHKLPAVLHLLAEPIRHSGKLNITVQHLGNFDRFEDDTDFKLNIYRIVQELVSNILKHAQATEAVIELRYTKDLLELTVEDNGRGYDTAKQAAGIGLDNVQTRVSYLGGDISITSGDGTGTSVYIQIDFTTHNKSLHHAHPGIHRR